MKVIVYTRRHKDIHAQLKDNPRIRATGQNGLETIGALVSNYPEIFDIECKYRASEDDPMPE